MTDLVFHRAEKYIEEDLEYYFSGERDIHSQVKPGENIYSFVPDSSHLSMDYNDGKIGNLFFPFAPGSLDRIYIGISFPLFANNWGAAFLRHLMTLVKPDGCVVLPVYPEMQASEKNYWARSILENIFISRSNWWGMSNIWAENDGVMSMRIGRKSPPEIESTANYLFRTGSQAILRHGMLENDITNSQNTFSSLTMMHWQNMQTSAIVERIIQDHFGRKGTVRFAAAGKDDNNTSLAIELLVSDYINVDTASSQISSATPAYLSTDIQAYHSRQLKNKLAISESLDGVLTNSPNVVSVIDSLSDVSNEERTTLLSNSWQALASGGLLIVHETPSQTNALSAEDIKALLQPFGNTKYYSAIAASEHKADVEISHYSLLIEQDLRDENASQEGVFWVVQK